MGITTGLISSKRRVFDPVLLTSGGLGCSIVAMELDELITLVIVLALTVMFVGIMALMA